MATQVRTTKTLGPGKAASPRHDDFAADDAPR
jgi:hypothetical protein